MKQQLQHLMIALVFIGLSGLYAQNVSYDLRCSADNSTYELYITRDTAPGTPLTNMASSRITLVLPTGTRTVSHSSEGGVTYTALPAISNPDSNGSDYYGFSTTGGPSLIGALSANVPTLWMTFTPSDGTSQDARLYVNGSDPGPLDTGMGGVDLTNTFFVITIGGVNDEYAGNSSNNVNCGSTLSTADVNLSAFTVYPNPTSDMVSIKGDIHDIQKIEIYDVQGKLVLLPPVNDDMLTIDMSALAEGVYTLKAMTQTEYRTIRVVKH